MIPAQEVIRHRIPKHFTVCNQNYSFSLERGEIDTSKLRFKAGTTRERTCCCVSRHGVLRAFWNGVRTSEMSGEEGEELGV